MQKLNYGKLFRKYATSQFKKTLLRLKRLDLYLSIRFSLESFLLTTFFVLSLRIFSKCKWSTVVCVMRAWNATHVAIMRLGVRIWECLVLGEIWGIFGLESHKFATSLQTKSSSREICRISFKDCKSSTNDLVFSS